MTQMTQSKVIVSKYIVVEDCKQCSVLAEMACDENIKFPEVHSVLVSIYLRAYICNAYLLLQKTEQCLYREQSPLLWRSLLLELCLCVMLFFSLYSNISD